MSAVVNFTGISSKYEKDSVVQKSASKILFDLLDIQPTDNVLDLGCGTGHITKIIRDKTNGKVVGVDPSKGMIERANKKYSDNGLVFRICSAEELDYENEFEIVFCNSAFQWFKNHKKALRACFKALRRNGKIAIQAPAKEVYCPNFITAINAVKNNESTKTIFESFRQPWLFLNTSEEYSKLFEDVGFRVDSAWIDEVVTFHSPNEVYKIFESGAVAGYLNQKYYHKTLTREYVSKFKNIVMKSFEEQAGSSGKVKLIFYRVYLLAIKE
jgi:trans-aconitate methyltransferase